MYIIKYIILLFLIINKVYSSAQNHLSTQLALLILAAGDNDGNIAKIPGTNSPLIVDIGKNGGEKYTIIDIIPALAKNKRNAEAIFKKLYYKAEQIYISKFGYQYDSQSNLLNYPNNDKNERAHKYINDSSNTNLINNMDLFNELVSTTTNNNNYLINSSSYMNIMFLNDNLQENFKTFLGDKNLVKINGKIDKYFSKKISNINQRLPKNVISRKENNYKKEKELYKAIATELNNLNNKDFKNNDNLVVIKSGRNCYHVIISSKDKIHHAFSLNENSNKYTINNNYSYDFPLSAADAFNKNHNYNRIYGNYRNGSERYVEDEGISIISDCEIYLNDNGNLLSPNKYKYSDGNDNENYSRINSKALGSKVAKREMCKSNKNILCSYFDFNKYISLEEIAGKFVSENTRMDAKKVKLIDHLSKYNLIEKLYPYSMDNSKNSGFSFEGFTNREHFSEILSAVNLCSETSSKQGSKFKCSAKISRRDGGSCTYQPKVNFEPEFIEPTLNTLHLFNDLKLDNNIFPYSSNSDFPEDISNPDLLYKASNGIKDIWEKLSQLYIDNISTFNNKQSKEFIINFNKIINSCIEGLSNSEYLYDNEISNINENSINYLKSLFTKIYNVHENIFGSINENDDNEMVDIYPFNNDSQSKLYKERLINIINKLYNIVNFNNDDIDIGMLFNIDDENMFDEEKLDDINLLCKDLENINIDGDGKNEYKKKLLKLYNILRDMNKIFDMNSYDSGEFVNNFEIINKLVNTIYNKLKKEFSDDEEIQNIQINDINSPIESTNIININHIVHNYGGDYIEYIINDINSKDYIKYFIDNLKFRILMMDGETLDEDVFNDIKSIEKKINDKIKQIKKYDSPEGHFEEIDHFVGLISEYNDLVTVGIANNKISLNKYDSNTINLIELDEETSNRINYIRTQKLLNGVNTIIKNNPELFEIDIKEKLESNINTSGANTIRYSWGNKETYEPTLSDYNKVLKTKAESKADVMTNIIDNASHNTDLTDIKDSYKIKRNLLKSHSPMSLSDDDIDEVSAVSERIDGVSNNWSSIESYQEYSSRSFMRFLKAAAKYDDYIDIENIKNNNDGTIDISSIYKDGSATTFYELFSTMSEFVNLMNDNDLLSENDKENINKATKELKKHVEGCKYKLSKSVGRENSSSFSQVLNEFNSISSSSEMLFKSNLKVNQNHPNKVDFDVSNNSNTEKLNNINKKFSSQTKNKRTVDARIKKLSKQRKRRMV